MGAVSTAMLTIIFGLATFIVSTMTALGLIPGVIAVPVAAALGIITAILAVTGILKIFGIGG